MMILYTAIAATFALSVNGVHQNADIYYHKIKPLGASMWHFSPDGLSIYSVDGTELLKEHPKSSLCKPYSNYRGEMIEDCYYFTQASDGHKYVWAGQMAGTHRVEAFDIDTGDYAGYMPTCSTPLDLEYHPTREEMWLRCAQEDSEGGHEGEIDVFSSNSLSADFEHISLNGTPRPYGRIAIHSTLGPYGYVSAYDQPYLSELDLSTKIVVSRSLLPMGAIGSYDMTYSPINHHLFTRARVCCTCGSPEADKAECGRYGGSIVDVKTGPSAGMSGVNGTCGSGCEGSLADTIGVFEFDTVGKKFVTNHNIKEGTGQGADPVASPDGKYILLLPNDSGKNVRIIMAGQNGEASKVVSDIPVDFQGGSPGRTVVSDFAFVQDDTRSILVLGASTDNNIVIVDLENGFRMRKLALTDAEESTGGTARNLEWAVGSDFVWVNGGETQEQYILELPDSNIDNAKIARTLSGIPSGQMIFVNNYARVRAVNEMMMAYSAMKKKKKRKKNRSR